MNVTVVLCDGGVSSLIAVAAAGLRAATGPAGGGAVALIYGPTEFHLKAATLQAAEFGLSTTPEHMPIDLAAIYNGDLWKRGLLDAALHCRGLGGGELIWPVAFEDRDGSPDVSGAAAAFSASILVSQLATLAPSASRPVVNVEVRAPYADLMVRQLAELVLDMDLPIWTCWWMAASQHGAGETRELALRERDRWAAALKSAGWAGSLEAKAAVVVQPLRVGPARSSTPNRNGGQP